MTCRGNKWSQCLFLNLQLYSQKLLTAKRTYRLKKGAPVQQMKLLWLHHRISLLCLCASGHCILYILGYICPGEMPYNASDSEAVLLILVFDIIQCPNLQTRVFVKTSPKHSYSVIENERFGLVFAKTGSINSGIGHLTMALTLNMVYFEFTIYCVKLCIKKKQPSGCPFPCCRINACCMARER